MAQAAEQVNQPGINSPATLPPWLVEILQAKKEEAPGNTNSTLSKCKIQRVPPIFRDTESSKGCYEPLMVSLGPYHQGTPKLRHMEKLKTSMTRYFINGTGKPAEQVYAHFLAAAKNAKTEYYILESEDDLLDDDEFLHFMFMDACFVTQFILSSLDRHEYGMSEMKSHEIAFVQRDLFLLENQLPFPLLKSLMMIRFTEDEFFEIIKKFIANVIAIRPKRAPWHRRMKKLFPKKQSSALTDRIINIVHDVYGDSDPIHLLHALQMQLVDRKKSPTLSNQQGDIWYSYRSVSELKAAGILFRPRRRSSRLTDIRFESNLVHGVLSLRPLVIDDQSKATFLNLCAFEALPYGPDDLGVTSYLCFLDSLIDSPEDVKELRSRGLLFNFLGSDQQVADMFNDVTDRLVPNLEAYGQVKLAIEKHYSNHVKTWFAEFLHEHFSSPWTVVGFLLAVLAIALSILQTYYAVYPHA